MTDVETHIFSLTDILGNLELHRIFVTHSFDAAHHKHAFLDPYILIFLKTSTVIV